MELDEFKEILNQQLATDHLYRSEADIAELLTKKANSVIGKIRKSLWFEIFSCILIVMVFGYLGFYSKYTSMNIYFSVFTILFIPFTVILLYLLKKINQLNTNNLSIKNNLQSIVQILEEFMKRYFQFTMALIPICFVFAFLLGYNEKQPIDSIDHLIAKYKPSISLITIFTFVYMTSLTVGIYYFTKWYLKKLYGNYVNELKIYINELKEEEA
jgi:hypothetical protein